MNRDIKLAEHSERSFSLLSPSSIPFVRLSCAIREAPPPIVAVRVPIVPMRRNRIWMIQVRTERLAGLVIPPRVRPVVVHICVHPWRCQVLNRILHPCGDIQIQSSRHIVFHTCFPMRQLSPSTGNCAVVPTGIVTSRPERTASERHAAAPLSIRHNHHDNPPSRRIEYALWILGRRQNRRIDPCLMST